ncbi:MAG TPA: phenylalanine--tRNA ligase subunit alpha, partial [Thermoplasmatales archaeon]|nr:phenylalanine--tRNA ligase subunit alpha [Thermoplasmatales archaeon]
MSAISAKELSINEKKVLLALHKLKGKADLSSILKTSGLKSENEVTNALSWLRYKGLVTLEENVKKIYALGKEGKLLAKKGLPERRALDLLVKREGKLNLSDLKEVLEPYEIPIAVGWLKKRGWANITKEGKETLLEVTDDGKNAINTELEEEKLLKFLKKNPWSEVDENKISLLKFRKGCLDEKEITLVSAQISDKGREIIKKGITIEEEITQLSSDIIKRGLWKRRRIRPYDIHAFVSEMSRGKPHPLVELKNRVREIFLEIGFEEIEGNYVESCFWNMDVLFIPQDHPARDMQDTLY